MTLVKALVYGFLGLVVLVPVALVLALLGAPVVLVLALAAVPVAMVLAVVGPPLILVLAVGLGLLGVVVGVLGMVLGLGAAIVKVALFVVLPLAAVGYSVAWAFGWGERRRTEYV